MGGVTDYLIEQIGGNPFSPWDASVNKKNTGTHFRFETRHTLSSMSHKPNLLSWDQDVAASPRGVHETDNNRTNSAALLATWHNFSFRHVRFSKLLSYQKLSQIILSYFLNALSFEQGKRTFQISGKLSSFAKITNRKIARHFENH